MSEKTKVVSYSHLPGGAGRVIQFAMILWLYADRYKWPQWLIGSIGCFLVLLVIGLFIHAIANEENAEPVWKE